MQLTSRQKIIIGVSAFVLITVGVLFFVFWTEESDSDAPVADTPTATENNDDIRIRHLELIKRSISEALARGVKLPFPENAVRIDFAETPLVHQGKTHTAFFDVLGLNNLVDPATKEPYDYALSPDGTKYQIIAHLDDDLRGDVLLAGHVVYSVWESTLFARDTKNQIISRDIAGDDVMDVSLTEDRRKIGLENFKSCQEIYAFAQNIARPKSGAYVIDINGKGTIVFCDMQTDGGGWTLLYANNGHEDSPIQKSYVEMRETMETEPLSDLSSYDDPNLAGLLDFTHFITLGSKEVLIRNRTGDIKKWVRFTFSTPRVLSWALWPLVLWKTDYGCIDVARRGTWSIINNDKTINYENLTQMMNHGGTSWGVSHEKYPCNGYEEWKNPHIGFYSANSWKFSDRARSNDKIGGRWGDSNEYRYFVR
jgi:hypothetical protein